MYVHKEALPFIAKKYTCTFNSSQELLSTFRLWNVVKFNLKYDTKISFLEYERFETTEFPCLIQSCQVDLKLQTIKVRKHSISNPPVLHRKELLMCPDHPDITKFQSLTVQLEKLGAFKNIVKLGTKLRWQDELDGLNIIINEHVVTKTGKQNNVS